MSRQTLTRFQFLAATVLAGLAFVMAQCVASSRRIRPTRSWATGGLVT